MYYAFNQLNGKKYEMGHLILACCDDTLDGYAPKQWICGLFALGNGIMSPGKNEIEEMICADFLKETFRLRQHDIRDQKLALGSVQLKEFPMPFYYDLKRYLLKKPEEKEKKEDVVGDWAREQKERGTSVIP